MIVVDTPHNKQDSNNNKLALPTKLKQQAKPKEVEQAR
jgi:hypothetical protein